MYSGDNLAGPAKIPMAMGDTTVQVFTWADLKLKIFSVQYIKYSSLLYSVTHHLSEQATTFDVDNIYLCALVISSYTSQSVGS